MGRNRTAGRIFEHELGSRTTDTKHLGSFERTRKYEHSVSANSGFNEVAVESIVDPNMDTELLAEAEERADKLNEMMKRLPADFREVLNLHYYEDMSTEEIAEELEISVGLVKTRLVRARAKLKELLDG